MKGQTECHPEVYSKKLVHHKQELICNKEDKTLIFVNDWASLLVQSAASECRRKYIHRKSETQAFYVSSNVYSGIRKKGIKLSTLLRIFERAVTLCS